MAKKKKPSPQKSPRPSKIGHIRDLTPDPANARKHGPRNVGTIVSALQEVGAARSIVIDEAGVILAGNATIEAAGEAGITKLRIVDAPGDTIVAVRRSGLTAAQKARLALFDNRAGELAEGWEAGVLRELQAQGLSLEGLWTEDELLALLKPDDPAAAEGEASKSLAERFGVPPFSVLDARQGYWQDRKRAWLSLGIRSSLGRSVSGKGVTTGKNSAMNRLSGRLAAGGDSNDGQHVTSIFDPVVCELAYRWFCAPGGLVLDPFAGGSVRGIVASKLGRRYVGIDLHAEQIAANREQALAICDGHLPKWIEGDSRTIAALTEGAAADFLFSCPPYGDLEVYSDNPLDLSTMDYPDFLAAYRAIIAAGVAMLREDRFACFVVGDIRDRQGFYRRFVSDTEQAFEDAGARLYNEAILVTSAGSLPLRAGKMFESTRKLGKTHQNVLVFCKGDPKAATEAVGPVEFGEALDDAAEGESA